MASPRLHRAPRTDPELRQRQLVRAALVAFAELGYAGVQLQAIAREVGVTRNLIHHYFPGGKRDLYGAAVRIACAELSGLMDVRAAVPLEQKTSANISRYLDEVLRPSPIYVLYARAMRSADDDIRGLALGARDAIASNVALNHLGSATVAGAVRIALIGYIAFVEATCEGWRHQRGAKRASLERMLRDVLVAVVGAARSADGRAGTR
jgi:AcrR family transcriptional regulator